MRRQLTSLGLAGSGWFALAATALPAAGPPRVLLGTLFLLLGPGTAAVRLAAPVPGGTGRRRAQLERGLLTLVVSVSLAALVATGFFLAHRFDTGRMLAALAALTTLLALSADGGPLRRLVGRARARRLRRH